MRPRSVRARATLGASIVVGVALMVAGVALAASLRRSHIDSIDHALALRAADVESLIDAGTPLDRTVVQSEDDAFTQIIDSNGSVLAASDNLATQGAVTTRRAPTTLTATVPGLADAYRMRVQATDGAQRVTIVVGSTLEEVERTQSSLVRSLLILGPCLLALVAGLLWSVIGRALRPVDAIRSRVDDIGEGQLNQRVPVPESGDEIAHLAETMNRMLGRLEDASERQQRFVSDASHELRTPIAITQHELEVAIAADDLDQWRRSGEELLDESRRMQYLVDDLLYLARLGRPGRDAHHAQDGGLVDLDDVVLAEVRRRPPGSRFDVSGVSAGQVRGRRDQLERVVRNLLDNADRHAREVVAVHVTSGDGHVVFEVEDDGEGVAIDQRDVIFERFGRADSGRGRVEGGTGLGLAIAREIVVAHGGTITVAHSPTLGGARFTVSLPDARRDH